jgi:hypothetical protein
MLYSSITAPISTNLIISIWKFILKLKSKQENNQNIEVETHIKLRTTVS